MSYIYLITNRINGKQYVGQHHYDGEGIDISYKGSGKLLKQAYAKYGVNNFKMEVLEYCSDSSMDELEIKWIQTLDTQAPNGYNIRSGGYGMSEEDRRYMSAMAKERYQNDTEYYNKIKEHLKDVQPKTHKDRIFICPLKLAHLNKQHMLLSELGEEFGCDFRIVKRRAAKYGIQLTPRKAWTGRTHTEEYKKKMSEFMTGHAVSDETRKKLSEAKKGVTTGPKSDETRHKMSEALKGRVFTDEWKRNLSASKTGKPNVKAMKPVRQIDRITHETISEWPSIQDAANSLGIAHADISKCCKGKAKTCGGYKWEYID